MVKISHVTAVHDRYDLRIFTKQCTSLAKAGFSVSLVVHDDLGTETKNGVHIVSTGYKPTNRVDRLLGSRRTFDRLVIRVDADIYHFHDPELLPLAVKIKKRHGKIVIFDFHENTKKQILDKGWLPYPLRILISNAYALYEKYAVKKFDALVTVTPEIVEQLRVNNQNTVMITNYPIIEPIQRPRADRSALCFAGGITRQWNHHNILKAIEHLEQVRYLLMGSGSKEYLVLLKNLPAWEKVDYMGRVPHSVVKRQYNNAFVGMALNHSTQIEGEGSLGNTKLFEYMEAALPVICSNYRLWEEIVEKHNCGITVDPKNVAEIAQAIEYLVNNPERAIEMGENGRKAVLEYYNWNTQEKVLLDLYTSLLEGR